MQQKQTDTNLEKGTEGSIEQPSSDASADGRQENTSQQKPMAQQIGENVQSAVQGAKENVQATVQGTQQNVQSVVEEAQQEVAAARVPWYRAVRRGQALVGIYMLFLVLFGLLAGWVYYHPIISFDITITNEFQEQKAPWLLPIMTAVSYIGNSTYLSFGLVILAALLFWLLRLRLEALLILAVCTLSGILNAVLKLLIGRPRPTSGLVDVFQGASGQSFPSGHVMSYVAFWGVLLSLAIILFQGKRWWRILLLIVPALFIVLVGPSRVYLGDHWASDVLGAYLISGALVGLSLLLYLRLKAKGVLSTKKMGKIPIPE